MSYDLSVAVPSWPTDSAALWIEELRLLGIEATVPPTLSLSSASGWLPVTVTIARTASFPYAREFRALGTFDSGFELSGDVERVLFSAKGNDGNAVAVWCAAALAAITGGTLTDPQAGITASGGHAIDILATLMRNSYFARSFCGPQQLGALPRIKPQAAPGAVVVAADPSQPVRAYAASGRFEVGERVGHPTFGDGVVEASEPGKLTVSFPGGRRVLAQSKEGAHGTAPTVRKPRR